MNSFNFADKQPAFDQNLVRKYDRNGPRYTSYPTADRFIEAYDGDAVRQSLAAREIGGQLRPLSLYVHIPFCNTICYYCACNKVVTKNYSQATRYLQYLEQEISMYSETVANGALVEKIHLGGGTPTFLSVAEMQQLMRMLERHFTFSAACEYAIEVDPRTVDDDKIESLGKLGFNRMSIGVQDFDPDVQQAVNRVQSQEQTFAVLDKARSVGFRSINIDLIYGLPKQTAEAFNRTLDLIIAAAPDRIALYSYAHLPQRFKPQRRINESDLPSSESKLQIMSLAVQRLTDAGYSYIGMDHFAKPDDELSMAQRQGRLHRNFQGYSSHAESDLLAFGVSAIGAIGPAYHQNHRTIDDYYDSLDRGQLPVMRGIELNADDLLRRAVIWSLMCNFDVSIEAIEVTYLIDFAEYFSDELEALKDFEQDGLVRFEDDMIIITEAGRFLVRNICMVFDRYLRLREQRAQYSKVI
ncbi:MAG: oxygen-independent coproporphyrinogen III oxidase [Pseudomonadota bacterium]